MPTSATLIGLLGLSYTSVYFVNAQVQCFWPNGTPSADSPCKSAGSASACCGLGWNCLSNGLCYSPELMLARGSCTDKTWSTSECPTYCASSEGKASALGLCPNSPSISDAGDNLRSYFCANGLYYNCSSGENLVLLNPNPSIVTSLTEPSTSMKSSTTSTSDHTATTQPSTSMESSTTSTSDHTGTIPPSTSMESSTTSTSNHTATTPPPLTTAPPSANHYLAIHLALGVPLGVTILGLVAFLFWRIRHVGKRTGIQPGIKTRIQQPVISDMRLSDLRQPSVAEMQQPSIAEMQQPSNSVWYELDNTSGLGEALPALGEM